jgi:4-carboxymuconolactone decarboxylase
MTGHAERLALPPEDERSPEQKRAAEGIVAGPRGELLGPFVPLLHSPELTNRLQLVGEHLRFGSAIDDDLFELAVLTVARHWNQLFEWAMHRPLAEAAAVPGGVLDEVSHDRRPSSGRPELATVWDAVRELLTVGDLRDETYRALEPLGSEVIVELVTAVGYYTTLALVMNVAGTVPPSGAPRLPPPD